MVFLSVLHIRDISQGVRRVIDDGDGWRTLSMANVGE